MDKKYVRQSSEHLSISFLFLKIFFRTNIYYYLIQDTSTESMVESSLEDMQVCSEQLSADDLEQCDMEQVFNTGGSDCSEMNCDDGNQNLSAEENVSIFLIIFASIKLESAQILTINQSQLSETHTCYKLRFKKPRKIYFLNFIYMLQEKIIAPSPISLLKMFRIIQ